MSTYQYQADWSRTVKDTGWYKMSSNILLIQERQSGQFALMSEGNIKCQESHLQIHHDCMHKDEYTNMRIISYDCDNLKPYEKGMKEICERAKLQGGYVSTLNGDDRRYIGVNGQKQTFDFVKFENNNSQYIGVYCYQVDMQKVWKLKNQQQKQSTYTSTHIRHEKSPQRKEKDIFRSERECRERMRKNTELRKEKEMKEQLRKEQDQMTIKDKLRKEKQQNERSLRLEMEYRERTRKNTAEKQAKEKLRKEQERMTIKDKLRKEKQQNERSVRLEMEYRERMRKKTALREEKEMKEREAKERMRKERERQKKAARMEMEKTNTTAHPEGANAVRMGEAYIIVYPEGATVRARKDLTSGILRVLDFHSIVIVEEVDGRRCRISHPYKGWVSLCTVDGQEILKKGVIIQQKQCCNIL